LKHDQLRSTKPVVEVSKTELIDSTVDSSRLEDPEWLGILKSTWIQRRRSVLNLGGPGLRPSLSLSQSSFFLPSRGLRVGLGRARSPAAKHFDAIYAVKQLYKIYIDV